ncbi:hypothetical protein CP8484711_1590B, partial [Chlamydia psittaci 84-8471/1]
FFLIGKP